MIVFNFGNASAVSDDRSPDPGKSDTDFVTICIRKGRQICTADRPADAGFMDPHSRSHQDEIDGLHRYQELVGTVAQNMATVRLLSGQVDLTQHRESAQVNEIDPIHRPARHGYPLQEELARPFALSSAVDHVKESTTEMIRVPWEDTQGGRGGRTRAPRDAVQFGSHASHDSLVRRIPFSLLEHDVPLALAFMTPIHLGTPKPAIGSLCDSPRQYAALVGILGAQVLLESVESLVALWARRQLVA